VAAVNVNTAASMVPPVSVVRVYVTPLQVPELTVNPVMEVVVEAVAIL
jgi:hypothetical protein